MERNEYLRMCQKVAVIPCGVAGIKKDVPDELLVEVDGIKYYPQAYIIDFNAKGEPMHTVTLHDLNTHSVRNIKLERVNRSGQADG